MFRFDVALKGLFSALNLQGRVWLRGRFVLDFCSKNLIYLALDGVEGLRHFGGQWV